MKKKVYSYSCERCFFIIEDEQRMINHVLKSHGVSGNFGKGYKTSKRYIDDGKPTRKTRLKL